MSSSDDLAAFEGASLSARAMAGWQNDFPYLNDLNPAQRAAAEELDGPVLMLAGAGTGKTKTLMARVAHLVRFRRVRSDQILAVTFTNKAAKEMKSRLALTPYMIDTPIKWMGTFHSLSVKILRRHAELVGLKSNFTILDTDDQIRLLKQIIIAANIDEKRWPARQLAGLIDNWKNRAWGPEQVPASDASHFNNMGTELYAAYQQRLLSLNATDFGDLLLHVVTIFQKHPDVLEQYQRWLKYILVDEYQDTNVAQYLWLRLLAAKHKNICCVGDDDQSIYGWRGAEVGNILRFEKDFPGAVVIRLEQNYRSTEHILAAASGLISANAGRLGKTLWTEAKGGEKVRLIGHWDGEEEARWIGEEAEALQRGTRGLRTFSLDEQAILVRASHQMRAFEDRFLTIGLPYRVIGGPRFYERLEIRDAMAYFRLAVSPDDDLAFERVVNTPKRGLGDKGMQAIQRTARKNRLSLFDAARLMVAQNELKGRVAASMGAFLDSVARWRQETGQNPRSVPVGVQHTPEIIPGSDEAWTSFEPDDFVQSDDDAVIEGGPPVYTVRSSPLNHVRLAERILDESGYTAMWQADKTPEAPGRLENLKELVSALEGFENLQGFLEHVSLVMDNDREDSEEQITIMTLHAAKGLEFPVVFLPGWEEGFLPSQRSMDESGLKGLEEERRLGYVGITRAEVLCTVSFVANRLYFGRWQSQMPSRFIDELPANHVDVLTPPGLYGGGYGAAAQSFGSSGIEDRAARADVYNSPGWKRMQDRSGQRPMSQPREARHSVIDLDAVSSFTEGDRVFHKKFGYGTVEALEGDKLEIAFDKAGVKHVLAGYVIAADIADEIPF